MKKLIALILALTITLLSLMWLASCAPKPEAPSGGNPSNTPTEPETPEDPEEPGDGGDGGDGKPTVIKPEFDIDGRESVNFSEINYVRPDVDALSAEFNALAEKIELNSQDFDIQKQLAAIADLEDDYINFSTMYSYANIQNYKNAYDEYWSAEYHYISTNSPKLTQAIEAMYVAAATSPHAETFESECFGEWLVEKYADGGKYTDELVALLSAEAELTSEYYLLSPSNVKFTFNGKLDTYENHIAELEQKYASGQINANYYLLYFQNCQREYQNALANTTKDIFIELLKVRRLIADELGEDSYLDVAYSDRGYSYTPEEYLAFVDDIIEYVIPVHERLSLYELQPFFSLYRAEILDNTTLLNSSYAVLLDIDPEFANIYAYMLGLDLYDVGIPADGRYEGSFVTYIEGNSSPYLFVTSDGSIIDYSTLFHEFGHFIDSYVNYGITSDLELAETCSQALSFMTTLELKNRLTTTSYKYIKYSMYSDALEALIFQGMYALFEHYVYSLSYDEITEANIDALARRAAREMLAENNAYSVNFEDLDATAMMIPHLITAPLYVQSYTTSLIPSLEIYLKENKNEGDGLLAYKAIIYREDDLNFIECITEAGLKSPFAEDALLDIANGIYYMIVGVDFFTPESDSSAA